MSRSITKRLEAQLKKILRDDSEYYTCWMDTEDIKIWYALVKNLPDPYEECEFLFKLIIPDNFPDEPPSLRSMTPNGLYEADGKRVCISIGEFHQSDYSKTSKKEGHYGWVPSLGISGFMAQGVVNGLLFFTDEEEGVRLNNKSDIVKRRLSKESKQFNIDHNSQIIELMHVHKECFPLLKIWQ